MLFRSNPQSGVPIYLQIVEQVKHAIETGALRAGEQLPGIRRVAEDLVINVNTVAKAYRELEHAGIVDLRQGAGAFIAQNGVASGIRERMRLVQPAFERAVAEAEAQGMGEDEMRRLFEGELRRLKESKKP